MGQYDRKRGFVASWLHDHSLPRFFGIVGFASILLIWGCLTFALPPAIGWYFGYAFCMLCTAVTVSALLSGTVSEPSTKLTHTFYWLLVVSLTAGAGVYEWNALPLPIQATSSGPASWIIGGILVLTTLYLANSFSTKQRLFSRIDETGRIA